MPLVIEESWLPATLTAPPMSDQEFAEYCSEHPDYFIEMTADGELIIMPPNFTLTGMRNNEICRQLGNWALLDGRGLASEGTAGFVLPSGARRSPDAAWTDKRRAKEMDPECLDKYWRLCPDFIIELRSQSDRLHVLRAKMREWVENGAHLAWLIDPERRAVEIYRPGREPETLFDAESVKGEGPVSGFVIEMAKVWDPRS